MCVDPRIRTAEVTVAATTSVATDANTVVTPGSTPAVNNDAAGLMAHYDPDRDIVRLWPANSPAPQRRAPCAYEHARELLWWLQSDPDRVGRTVTASDLEKFVYPGSCRDLGWAPRSWRGNSGVAKYLAWMTSTRYERIERDVNVSNVRVYCRLN
jgi:hypothetical protein